MMPKKKKYRTCFAVALAIFVASPLDDMVIAAVFGTALFGFGSTSFYMLLIASSTISAIFWKRQSIVTHLKRYSSYLIQKHLSRKLSCPPLKG
jgi:hypothetical protein